MSTQLILIDYNNRVFRAIQNTENGETSSETMFHYKQIGTILTCDYSGGKISFGQLIGVVKDNGTISMAYQQVNDKNEIRTGICNSRPEILANGKIRLHENWTWTSGDLSKGYSILEEI